MPGAGRRPRVAGQSQRPLPPVAPSETTSETTSEAAPVAPRVVPAEAAPAARRPAELLVVGRIGRPQGIRGEVTVEVHTDDPQARFAAGGALPTDPPDRGPLVVASTREQGGRLVVLFEDVPDRNAAEALRGTLLLVDPATLPVPDDPDEFHDFQLVGLAVELPDGTPLGTVSEVLHLPHGDVLVVRRPAAAELLVPFVAAMVPVVDVAGSRVVVDPPEGLLDLSGPG